MTDAARKARIEVFRSGTFTPMVGAAISYSAADLRAVVDAYDRDTAPAPIVVGHPSTDAPAFGWVESFDYDASADRLFANLHEIEPSFSEAVKAGRYKKVSLEFFRPDSPANPTPGSWYPKHVGFLGAAAPAVAGLRNVQFASAPTDVVTFEASFGERGFEDAASLFRGIREFFIEKFGLEDADKALPGYRIEWLDQVEIEPKAKPAFTAPSSAPKPQEPALNPQTDPAFAAREADLNARDEKLKQRERALTHADNVSFAEGLVNDGRLIAASKDKVVALLDALPVETSVSFAAGEAAVPVAQAVRDILSAQPKVVSFGAADLGDDPTGRATASFASDGREVDPGQLARHEKALAYQRQHPGTDYLAAVAAVS